MCIFVYIPQQTIEPTLYDDDEESVEYGPLNGLYNMNVDYDALEPSDLEKLIRLLQQRGHRAYDDDEGYY